MALMVAKDALSSVVEELLKENAELRARNASYLDTIRQLSKELYESRKLEKDQGESRKRKLPLEKDSEIVPPKLKVVGQHTSLGSHQAPIEISALPPEIVSRVLCYLPREDLDRCETVCRSWWERIKDDANQAHLHERRIHTLKLIERNGHVTLSAATKAKTKIYRYLLTEFESSNVAFVELRRLLKNARVRRWILANINISEEFVNRFQLTMRTQLTQLHRLEMLACNVQQVSPDNFHRFLGRVGARNYFIDGTKNATEHHFSHALLAIPSILSADDLTLYDIRTLNDDDEVIVNMGDDSLLNFIFGKAEEDKAEDRQPSSRSSLYVDSPDLTSDFLHALLQRFATCEPQHLERITSHVEFAHCPEQRVPNSKHIIVEYDQEIQAEWSTKNVGTGRIMEVRASRNSEADAFCHLTINLQPEF